MNLFFWYLYTLGRSCIGETNPCGTQVTNGKIKCCPGLVCYEETACINKTCLESKVKFGNCYNATQF